LTPAAVSLIATPDLADLREQLVEVYRAAFAAPPYREGEAEVRRFAEETLPRHAQRPGFRCCVARDRDKDLVVGFAYGYTGQAGQWWHDVVARALDRATADRWLPGSFEFVELAVTPAAQGRGIGGRLHDALMEGLPHRTALLSTRRAETPALRLYRRRGWVPVLENFVFPGGAEPYVILGLDLSGRSSGAGT
jgi:ribosomal protein S18 acetylase RimI-like enzyme